MTRKLIGIASIVTLVLVLSGCALISGNKADTVETTTMIYFASKAKPPVPPPVPAPPPSSAPVIVQGIVYFDFDKHNIKPAYTSVMEAHARMLRDNPATVVRVEGHTDVFGSESYNQPLALLRAGEVSTALINLGVSPRQLEPVGFSFHQPAVPGRDAASRARNRRVEVFYPNVK